MSWMWELRADGSTSRPNESGEGQMDASLS